MTKEDVVLWIQANPQESRDIFYSFELGSAAGALFAAGWSEDRIRDTLELSLSVLKHGYQSATGAPSLKVVSDEEDGK